MPTTRVPPPPDRTTYAVTYAVAGEPGVRRAEVTVVPGYSQESDIPRLLAARLTGRPADARRIVLLALRETGTAARRPRRRTGHRGVSPA
ncbi:hypothetical protein [Streptomyces sp. CB01881]|uniref:hypothetical protein n=1 Tax=Streptomyces sp. CB01881 TaxID=2078691 RepID=UPI0011DFB315|nr:hypothetical protein [Streptomyces sp. CB01881]TYC70589.1 hypothetical protein EH183_32690 [Streptomyces sp. CB01881]